MPPYAGNFTPVGTLPHQAVDNLEYHMMKHNTNLPSDSPTIQQKKPNNSDAVDTDEHEYYNDYDGLQRELMPLNNHRSETTVRPGRCYDAKRRLHQAAVEWGRQIRVFIYLLINWKSVKNISSTSEIEKKN